MRAADLINLLSQYDPDMEVPVSFQPDEQHNPIPDITTCNREQRSRCYESLVEQAEDGMLVINAAGHITYMNPYLVRLSGYSAAELTGKTLAELMPADDADFLQQRLAASSDHGRFSSRLISRNRQQHWVQISATRIPSSDGRFRGYMMTLTDLSQQQILLPQLADQHQLGDKIERIRDQLEQLKVLRTHLLTEQQQIAGLSRIEASASWHQGRYLYLIEPQKNGKRKRRYVGSDPDKVRQALAAVKRQERYQQLSQELLRIEEQIRSATFRLDSFLWDLAQVPPELHRLLPASA